MSKELRNQIAGDIWNEEQQVREVLKKFPFDQHLNGVVRGLQRARDIVKQEGPPPESSQSERLQMIEEELS